MAGSTLTGQKMHSTTSRHCWPRATTIHCLRLAWAPMQGSCPSFVWVKVAWCHDMARGVPIILSVDFVVFFIGWMTCYPITLSLVTCYPITLSLTISGSRLSIFLAGKVTQASCTRSMHFCMRSPWNARSVTGRRTCSRMGDGSSPAYPIKAPHLDLDLDHCVLMQFDNSRLSRIAHTKQTWIMKFVCN